MTEKQVEGNKCKCLNITCDENINGPCSKDACKTCKSCCSPGCKGCIKNCSTNEPCPCDGYVIGRCPDGIKCQGHVKYDNGKPVWDRKEYENNCRKLHGVNCTYNCDRWAIGVRDMNKNCVIICTYCNKLCSQDWCRIWLGVLIIGLIILSCFIVMWGMFPETFHRMTTGIRAAFPISPVSSCRSPSHLVGDRIPDEVNIDRYPAFSRRTYAGLS
ncbi:Metallothionein like protein, putative [Babesia bigemina]|uniref:Metallothionein like protein, putative n=1 Tax=Babesia bigemina TaxID=5866 RepID=A0A061D9G8_BABBI|nr:Metallothionein like protein, putative [Babesia bigemina]CDR96637.1 Metallothionein like protein, putative [Babesia bigemina]|eukprot:XP_012768823.1 Metallothionein like protein, putative [Babesia bigemina]